MNRVIESSEIKFEGDFYHYENKNGYGMVVKINSEGDKVFKICIDKCKCVVECEYDQECENKEMECVNYQCVERRRKKRRETEFQNERRVEEVVKTAAGIVISIPLSLCILGIFTSIFVANDYKDEFSNEKCKDVCPSTAEDIEYETALEKGENIKGKDLYICETKCSLNEERLEKFIGVKCDKGPIKYCDENDLSYSNMQDVASIIFKANKDHLRDACSKETQIGEVITDSEIQAIQIFNEKAQGGCLSISEKWINDVDLKDGGKCFSEIFDLGYMSHVCDLAKEFTTCKLKKI